MGTSAFQQNTAVRMSGKEFVMLRKVADDLWQLEESKTKRIHEMAGCDLRRLYVSGELEFARTEEPPLGRSPVKGGKAHLHVPEPLLEDGKVRRAYALAARALPATRPAIEKLAQDMWIKLGKPAHVPNWTTVLRWRKKLINAGLDIHAVIAKHAKRGNRKRRYPKEVVSIVEEAIDSVYLKRERGSVQDVVDRAIADVQAENERRPKDLHLPEPTYRLVGEMIREIPAFDRCVAREGREVATRRFRSVQGHRTTCAPLERAEIDHTLMDLMVIDDDSGLPLGRPVLTACIDDYTRCVLGINLGFEPPSYLTVARCLKHAFLPKTNLKTLFPDVLNDWDAHGVMAELSMDNGLEFHSQSLEEGCYSLGIEIHYSPRKRPWFKGKIERFLGTLNREAAHIAPGTTFSNIFEKDDYDPVKHAVVRLSTLQKVVRMWIADVYHARPHRSLKVPPIEMWRSSVNLEDIRLPDDPERLDAILGRRESRVLTHKGIEFGGLLYNSPDMTTLRMHLGEKLDVEICVDDGDIGKIVVLSPDKKRMFTVPALAQAYAKGLTSWQHKICKRFAAKQMEKYDSSAWLKAKERIAEMIRNELALKKARGKMRARVARFKEGGQTLPEQDASTPPPVAPAAPSALPTAATPVPEAALMLSEASAQGPAPISATTFEPPAKRKVKAAIAPASSGAAASQQGDQSDASTASASGRRFAPVVRQRRGAADLIET